MADVILPAGPEIRHHQQDHARIWVTPIDGDKMHVAVANLAGCATITLSGEVCASLFAPAHQAQHAPT
ncbi:MULTISPECIES: hypothetical protein [unclassified Novosphingobium]|uniref:hypothetical protein n=1 Tax=unclassified Novosphingobium TaxID=2644732 RepID=UPI000D316100|nr:MULTISPECIES: hypothetical protein [unclassified Novosphingobium]PTR05228.1 hypothetical protein C8K11_1394 [Novosphingobium sp. GV055]PUA93827.1 hypothetical protein C8K12_1394 [Novosphingobium sp. GV061]PUB10821.1 hypothetical protein C8K14_1394 [Novosphingobium sp. GV079]PUB36465.1 hypothetical protein C8K10_1394 [Novosphingobium sp. GV027]